MLNKEEQDKIEDYLKGQADNVEKAWVAQLFSEGFSNESLKQNLLYYWENINKESGLNEVNLDLDPILDRLHHKIHLNELEKQHKPFRRITQVYMKIAAIMLLPIVMAGAVLFSYFHGNDRGDFGSGSDATIYAPIGSRITFNLPDGTTGKLNSGSFLKYSIPFTKRRQVSLSGEAWFEVKSDPRNPFYISAGESTVKVTGTKFNLSAYPVENCIEIVLDEGKIEFKPDSSDNYIMMSPSERLVLHNGNIRTSFVVPDKYHAWTDGKLVFKNDTMGEVVRRLERWYDVKISITDEELEKYSFHAAFQDDSVEEVLRLLALTSPIGYKITPRSLTTDGSYSKKEILIYKKK